MREGDTYLGNSSQHLRENVVRDGLREVDAGDFGSEGGMEGFDGYVVEFEVGGRRSSLVLVLGLSWRECGSSGGRHGVSK